jgi:signal transduction histidine kinase/DNA-binding response OmpR family regulator
MTSNRIIYFLLSAFIAGNLLIIFVQYNSTKNIHNLITGNKKLLNELNVGNQLREAERDVLASEIRLGRAVATNDTLYLLQVDTLLTESHALLDTLRAISDQESTIRDINQLSELADEKLKLKSLILGSYRQGRRISRDNYRAIMKRRLSVIEVNNISRRIYTNRQRFLDSLALSINSSGRRAQRWNIVMILIVLGSGAIMFWYIISRIRRQNLLIQQLDTSEKKVREVSMIKENFMANMSHEIRTPMNAILGFTNLMKARNRDPELEEFVKAIGQSGESLLTIINDILDISKIEAGMMRIEHTSFSVRGLIHSVQTMFAEKMQEKGLDFSTAIDEFIPDSLSGDPTRLTQILVNMIGNAVKFTSEGAIGVTVDNKGREGNRIRLGFVISDTGIGITKEKLAGIFERFRQAEDSITRKYGGTGLGLAIAKDLISLQGGEIEVESEPGKGTIFRFSIPYEIADEPVKAPAVLEPIGSGNADYGHVRVLVVEDNEMNQRLLRHVLTGWKLSLEMVGNGIEALEKLRTGTFDLVLMDIQMPGMDGYTATQEIRTKLKLKTPIIAMTAHAFPGERDKCLSYGMNEYIAKPIKEKELFRLVAQLTGMEDNRPDVKKEIIKETPATYQFIDLQYMWEISNGNKDYERTVTEQFMEIIPVDLDALESALGNIDLIALRRTAHAMRTDVAIMGLLERMQPFLDTLEHESFDEQKFKKAVLSVKTICVNALPEARHFYASLNLKINQ